MLLRSLNYGRISRAKPALGTLKLCIIQVLPCIYPTLASGMRDCVTGGSDEVPNLRGIAGVTGYGSTIQDRRFVHCDPQVAAGIAVPSVRRYRTGAGDNDTRRSTPRRGGWIRGIGSDSIRCLTEGASIRVESDAESRVHPTVTSTSLASSGNSISEGAR